MSEVHPALGSAADLPASTSAPAVLTATPARAQARGLTVGATLAVGAPQLFGAAMLLVVAVFLSKFYVDVVSVPAGVLAVAIAVGRAFDAVVDPAIGWVSDHTRSRWGRRKPWIFVGVLGNACAFYALLNPPASLSPENVIWWFGASFLITFVCSAIALVSRQALMVELTFNAHERQRLFGIVAGFIALGTIVGALMPLVLRGLHVTAPRDAMSLAAKIYVTGYLLTNAMFLLNTRERKEFVGRGETPFVPGVRRALRSAPFRVMFSAHVVTAIPLAMPGVLMPFFVQYVLRLDGLKWTGAYLVTYLGSGFLALPLWMLLARRIGKHKVWLCLGFVSFTGLAGMFFLGPGDEYAMLALQLYVGTQFAAYLSLGGAMHADVIDYDELHTGKRREAQFSALWSIIPKFALIPGTAIPLAILGTVGYVPRAPMQSEEVVLTLRVLFALVPAILSFAGLVVMWFYPLSEARHHAIREGVRRHELGQDAIDPITGQRLPPPFARAVDDETSWFLDYFSSRELTRMLATGSGPLGSVLLKAGAFASVLIASVVGALSSITSFAVDPGPRPSLAIVVGGLALSGLLFHLMRIAPALRLARATPPRAMLEAHLAMTRGEHVDPRAP